MPQNCECPTCGRDDFASEMGMKQHHKRSHGESISGVVLECQNCGNTYSEKPSRVDRSSYCSRECRRDRISMTCTNCGVEYEVMSHRSDSKFCSIECMAEHKSTITGEDHPLYDGGPSDKYKRKGWTQFADKYKSWVGCCEYCGNGEELHLHHVEPISMGGHFWKNDFKVLCKNCHFGNYRYWHPKQLSTYLTNSRVQ